MNTRLTLSDYKVKLADFYTAKKRMPSYAELMKVFSVRSKDTAYSIIQKLVDAGVVEKDLQGKLIPSAHLSEIKMLGLVEAGFPATAEEDLAHTISLDDFLIPRREASYMLRVKGDSMIEAGIRQGDFVIVERGKTPKQGDIVIARVDGEFTLKYYRTDKNGRKYLEPANSNFKPIYPSGELVIEAVVRAVIRKY